MLVAGHIIVASSLGMPRVLSSSSGRVRSRKPKLTSHQLGTLVGSNPTEGTEFDRRVGTNEWHPSTR